MQMVPNTIFCSSRDICVCVCAFVAFAASKSLACAKRVAHLFPSSLNLKSAFWCVQSGSHVFFEEQVSESTGIVDLLTCERLKSEIMDV